MNSEDVRYFAKRLSEGALLSSHEIQEVVEQVAWTVKEGASFFPPIPPPLALGSIEVAFDGKENRILASRQASADGAPKDEDLLATVPQPVSKQKKRSILHSPPRGPPLKRIRSKPFWKKNKETNRTVATASF